MHGIGTLHCTSSWVINLCMFLLFLEMYVQSRYIFSVNVYAFFLTFQILIARVLLLIKLMKRKKLIGLHFGVAKNIPFSKSTKKFNTCMPKSFICSVLVMVLCWCQNIKRLNLIPNFSYINGKWKNCCYILGY